jgi:hypothetical protein
MLTDWNNTLNTDCEIIRMGNDWIYPIFKNGWNGFRHAKEESKFNEQIADVGLINIYLRNPVSRFNSGVNKYAQDNGMEPDDVVYKIETEGLTNRHWMPQWYWLLHLSRYYKKSVRLLPMSAIPHTRKNETQNKKQVRVLDDHVAVDLHLMDRWLNTTTDLAKVLEESRHVLS